MINFLIRLVTCIRASMNSMLGTENHLQDIHLLPLPLKYYNVLQIGFHGVGIYKKMIMALVRQV